MRTLKILVLFTVIVTLLCSSSLVSIGKSGTGGDKAIRIASSRGTCTVMAVGKDATEDGSVINCQTWDISGPGNDVNLIYVPAADHALGETRTVECFDIYDWKHPVLAGKTIQIPQVPHTYAVIQCEVGIINEYQVSIMASTNCEVRPELAPFTKSPYLWEKYEPYGSETHSDAVLGISEAYELTLERAKTAREAVKVMTSLYEKYGFYTAWAGTGETAVIADPYEVWILDVLPVGPKWRYDSGKPGAIWAAMRVPDDCYFIVANEMPIGKIDPSLDRFMVSSNALSFAEERGWWKLGEPFCWDKIYGTDGPPNSLRHFLGVSMAAPSLGLKPYAKNYPRYVKPDKKLSVLDMRRIYLSRYEGTEIDLTKQIAAGPYSNPWWPTGTPGKIYGIPSMSTRRLSIAQSRCWLPDPIGGVLWHGFSNPVTNILVPFYAGITRLPEAYTVGNLQSYNPESAFWICNLLDTLAQTCYSPIIKEVRKEQCYIENRELTELKGVDFDAYELYRSDKAAAREYLTEYCINNANRVLEKWKQLFARLIVRYDSRENSPSVPTPTNSTWIKAVETEQKAINWRGDKF